MDLLKAPQPHILINDHSSKDMKDKQTDMNKHVSMTTTVIVAIVALIIGFAGGWVVADNGSNSPAGGSSSQNTPATSGTSSDTTSLGTTNALDTGSSLSAPSVAAITVDNQKVGPSVMVSLVSSDASAWVAVRENNNGLVGNILGAKRVDVGTTGNVEVPLLRSTEVGKSYFVVLFKDNGDRQFDFKTDPPMTTNGVFISKMFTVSQ